MVGWLAHSFVFPYSEKVVIPQDKPYIILEGHPKFLTAIEFGDFGSVGKSPTFTLLADNFVARNILFKVTPELAVSILLLYYTYYSNTLLITNLFFSPSFIILVIWL